MDVRIPGMRSVTMARSKQQARSPSIPAKRPKPDSLTLQRETLNQMVGSKVIDAKHTRADLSSSPRF
jgi:hypothetical protein